MNPVLAIFLLLITFTFCLFMFWGEHNSCWTDDTQERTWCPVCKRLTRSGAICWEHGNEDEK